MFWHFSLVSYNGLSHVAEKTSKKSISRLKPLRSLPARNAKLVEDKRSPNTFFAPHRQDGGGTPENEYTKVLPAAGDRRSRAHAAPKLLRVVPTTRKMTSRFPDHVAKHLSACFALAPCGCHVSRVRTRQRGCDRSPAFRPLRCHVRPLTLLCTFRSDLHNEAKCSAVVCQINTFTPTRTCAAGCESEQPWQLHAVSWIEALNRRAHVLSLYTPVQRCECGKSGWLDTFVLSILSRKTVVHQLQVHSCTRKAWWRWERPFFLSDSECSQPQKLCGRL